MSETTEFRIEQIGSKEAQVAIVRRTGAIPYASESGMLEAEAETVFDAGKLGTTRCLTLRRTFTPEERAAGRDRALQTLAEVLQTQRAPTKEDFFKNSLTACTKTCNKSRRNRGK